MIVLLSTTRYSLIIQCKAVDKVPRAKDHRDFNPAKRAPVKLVKASAVRDDSEEESEEEEGAEYEDPFADI